MYKDCFCFDDKHIPYIEIENNMILVKFPLNGDLIGFEFKKFMISTFKLPPQLFVNIMINYIAKIVLTTINAKTIK